MRRHGAAVSLTTNRLVHMDDSGTTDSSGTDFWLTFPQNYNTTPSLQLFVTSDTDTTGIVSIPGLSFTQDFSTTARMVTAITIPAAAELVTSDQVENLGIHVTSDAPVTVYGLNRIPYTTDAYLGLPTGILGTEYLTLGYKNQDDGGGSEFALVATQDGTTVTIVPAATTGSHTAGTPYTVSLSQGQTYQLQDQTPDDDLSGSIVTADKPVAVFAGHVCANIPLGYNYCDHIVEEMTPTQAWGKDFVTVPLATRTKGDTFRILADIDDTHVSINGTQVATLDRGEFWEQIVTGLAQITADQPVLVAQYSNSTSYDGVTSDPFEMLIPPYEQWLTSYTVTTPNSGFTINYINVAAPSAAVGTITLDGAPIPVSRFTPIGSSGFSGAQLPVSLGAHSLASTFPFGVTVYGFATDDSYGYPGGFSLARVATVAKVTLAPSDTTAIINTQNCETATAVDQLGQPVSGLRVDLTVTGANPARTSLTTGVHGQVQFCYVGTTLGQDTITAAVGTLSATAHVVWTLPPTNTPTSTNTPTPSNTATATNTLTPTHTATATHTPTPSNTATSTHTSTPSNTLTLTNTPTATATNTLTATTPQTPTTAPSLQAAPALVAPGDQVQITAYGFLPQEAVQITLRGSDFTSQITVNTDDLGSVNTGVVIPALTAGGTPPTAGPVTVTALGLTSGEMATTGVTISHTVATQTPMPGVTIIAQPSATSTDTGTPPTNTPTATGTPTLPPNVPTTAPIFGQGNGPQFNLGNISINPDPPQVNIDNTVSVTLTNPNAQAITIDAELQLSPLGIGQPIWTPIGRVSNLQMRPHASVLLQAIWHPTSTGHRCARVVVYITSVAGSAVSAARSAAAIDALFGDRLMTVRDSAGHSVRALRSIAHLLVARSRAADTASSIGPFVGQHNFDVPTVPCPPGQQTANGQAQAAALTSSANPAVVARHPLTIPSRARLVRMSTPAHVLDSTPADQVTNGDMPTLGNPDDVAHTLFLDYVYNCPGWSIITNDPGRVLVAAEAYTFFTPPVANAGSTIPEGASCSIDVVGQVQEPGGAPPAYLGGLEFGYHAPALASRSTAPNTVGLVQRTWSDLAIPGRGLALSLTHSYNDLNVGGPELLTTGSAQSAQGYSNGVAVATEPMGIGWTNSYNMFLTMDPTGVITVTGETGNPIPFTPPTSGSVYVAPSYVQATLVKNSDGTFTFTRKFGQSYHFAAPISPILPEVVVVGVDMIGRLVSETDRNGYTTTLAYNNVGQLSKVTDPAGRSLTFSYDSAGHVTSVSDPIGRTVKYSYDSNDNLISATDVGGGVTSFTYDSNHFLLSETDPRGGVTRYTYDANERLTSETDPLGRTTTFSYIVNEDGAVTTTTTDPRGNQTVTVALNNEIQSITRGYGTPQQATWTYTYDPTTQEVTSITAPNGTQQLSTWDAHGNMLSKTDALGRVTTYTYDDLNDVTSITDPRGEVTRMTYDANGNLLSIARSLASAGDSVAAAHSAAVSFLRPKSHARVRAATTPATPRLTLVPPTGVYSQTIHLTVTNFAPRERVRITVNRPAQTLGTLTTDAHGSATTRLPVPSMPQGAHTVTATGSSSHRVATTTFTMHPHTYLAVPSVVKGQRDVLTGTGFTAGDTVRVYWSRRGGQVLATTHTDPVSGSFMGTRAVTFTVPLAPIGAYNIVAVGARSGAITIQLRIVRQTATSTRTPTRTPTATRTRTATQTATQTPTSTAISRPVAPPTLAPTNTSTPAAPATPTASDTMTATLVPTSTATSTAMPVYIPPPPPINPVPPTQVPASTATATNTPGLTSTQTSTAVPAQTASATATASASSTLTPGAGVSATSTSTVAPAQTLTVTTTTTPATQTPTPASSGTAQTTTATAISSSTLTPATSASPTATTSGSTTASPSPTGTGTATATMLASPTTTGSSTVTASPSSTATGSSTVTQTPTATGTATLTSTITPTGVPTVTLTPTQTPSAAIMSVTTFTYDPAHPGDMIARTDPDGHTSHFAYDTYGNLVSSSDALGNTTTHTYDLAGRMLTTVRPQGNVGGGNPLNYTTTMTYDAFGDTTSVTDALGNRTTYTYDANRNLTGVTNPRGFTTTYVYDAANQRTRTIQADGSTTNTTYDGDGNAIAQTDPRDHTATYAYDALNQLIGVTDPLSGTTTYAYDLLGNRTSMTDARGNVTQYTYDADNEPTKVTQADNSAITATYDADGNVISRTDAAGHTTTYTYDALNRLTTTTDPLHRTTTSSYDLAGNRIAVTDAQGRVTTYTYDAANRLTGITYSDGATPDVGYTYTADGQRASMSDGSGTTMYTYDRLDRLTATTNGAGHSVGYAYDADGNITTITYPDGSKVTRGYDSLDRVNTVSDWLDHTTSFAYDAAGNLTSRAYPNGVTEAMTYDAASRLSTITDSIAGSTFWTFSYSRDPLGQITSSADPVEGLTHSYSYGTLNQLVGDQPGSGAAATWTVDSANSITQLTNPAQTSSSTLTYDQTQELTGVHTTAGATVTQNLTLSYNADGDRTTQTDSVSGASTSYSYDQANRLIAATVNGAASSYSYDGDGLRTRKTVAGVSEDFTWDTAEGLPLLLQDGATRFIYGPDGVPIEQIAGYGTVLYYLHDQLGSTRGMLDASGSIVASYSYDPYGTRHVHTGQVLTPLGFAGQYTDAETGLLYLRARYYDPATAQFLTVDPLANLTAQPYSYASANPLNAGDPTGLAECGSTGPAWWFQLGVDIATLLVKQAVQALEKDVCTTINYCTPAPPVTIIRDVPPGAVQYTTSQGDSFWAPSQTDWSDVYAAGQANGEWDVVGGFNDLKHFGTFDLQRDASLWTFYSQYTDASNYAVGVYLNGAGFSYQMTIDIASQFASSMSINAGSERQVYWWTVGWYDADSRNLAQRQSQGR